MSVQEEFVTKIIQEKTVVPAIEAGIESSWFDTDNRKAWSFVLNHWNRYGKVPSKAAFKRQFPNYVFMDSKEPLAYHIDILRNAHQDFLLREAISKVEGSTLDEIASVPERVDQLAQDLLHVRRIGSDVMDHPWGSDKEKRHRLADYEEAAKQKGLRGIPTPWKELTSILLGWQRRQLITVSSRPGVGKSWLLCIAAWVAKKHGHNVLFFSNEMTETEMGRRMDSLDCGISATRMRYAKLTPAELKVYKAYLTGKPKKKGGKKEGQVILVTDDGEHDVKTGTLLARAKLDVFSPDLLIIDGAYLMRNTDKSSRVENLYAISADLKRISRAYNVPTLISVQMGRPKNEREARYGGSLSGMQWSDSWAQDSDVVMELVQNPTMKADRRMRIRVLKQRDGPLGELETRWDFEAMDFSTLSTTDGDTMQGEEQELLL